VCKSNTFFLNYQLFFAKKNYLLKNLY